MVSEANIVIETGHMFSEDKSHLLKRQQKAVSKDCINPCEC